MKDLEPCKKLIEKANGILGYDILELCLNGPEEKLEETKYCQPAMFVANCCAVLASVSTDVSPSPSWRNYAWRSQK